MSDDDLPDLPPDVADLLRDVRAVPEAPAPARRRIAARLALTIGMVLPSATLAGARLGGRAWLAKTLGMASLVALVGAVTGVVSHRAYERTSAHATHASPRPRTLPPPATPLPAALPVAPIETPSETLPETPVAPSPASPALSAHAPAAMPDRSAAPVDDRMFHEELGLLDRAMATLGRGDAAGAEAVLSQHARRFPRGRLAPEREALRVRCAVARGDRAAAEAARRRFHRRFSASVLGAEVDHAVDAMPPSPARIVPTGI